MLDSAENLALAACNSPSIPPYATEFARSLSGHTRYYPHTTSTVRADFYVYSEYPLQTLCPTHPSRRWSRPIIWLVKPLSIFASPVRELDNSIRQMFRGFHDERIELPVNKPIGGQYQLVWNLPSHSFVSDVLHNSIYAGVYEYGRYPIEVVVKDDQPIKRQGSKRAPEDAEVFIRDHHPSYFSWDDYERKQRIMHSNGGNFNHDESVAGVRSDHGLLTGLLRCARCGHQKNRLNL